MKKCESCFRAPWQLNRLYTPWSFYYNIGINHIVIDQWKGGENMGMSDQQFEVYNALISFVDELIDKEKDEKEREKLKLRKKNILANNKEITT